MRRLRLRTRTGSGATIPWSTRIYRCSLVYLTRVYLGEPDYPWVYPSAPGDARYTRGNIGIPGCIREGTRTRLANTEKTIINATGRSSRTGEGVSINTAGANLQVLRKSRRVPLDLRFGT